jgi:16S rRNA (uracil1498-N3)-methyltransferase
MELFYTTIIDGETAVLEGQESMHCTRVLRHNPGDTVNFTDGKGKMYLGVISEIKNKRTLLQITGVKSDPDRRGYHLHMAVALTKNFERYELFLEKAVEIGVDRITPIVCDHSERKIFKRERSQRIILSAMKQSLKFSLPKLDDVTAARDLIVSGDNTLKIMGHCREGEKSFLPDILTRGKHQGKNELLIMIGPEGDFSVEEIGLAHENGFEIMDLGRSRMRVETAAITSVAAVYLNYL